MATTRYDTVLAALDAGVVIHAADTSILEANERARQILGLRDLAGRLATDPAWVFFEEDLTPMALERFPVMQAKATGRPVRGQIVVVRPPVGPDIIAEVNALPLLDDEGVLQEVVITFIDVTVRETKRRDAEQLSRHLAEVAITDELTGVNNRRGILDRIGQAVAHADSGAPLCVLMLDLDRFKQVNDNHGHARGDQLLAEVGRQITGSLRRHDVTGRFGGEEFLIVLPDTSPADAEATAERVRARIEEAGSPWAVTASVGVVSYRPGEGVAAVIRRADEALYTAKAAGRNTICCG